MNIPKVLALDLSKWSTGWAAFDGAEHPYYGHWQLGSEYTRPGEVYAKLHHQLIDLRTLIKFETIYYEEAIQPQNLTGHTNIQALRIASGLAAHVESYGAATGCRTHAINVSNWRKDFVGPHIVKDTRAKARALSKAKGSRVSARDELKALTRERCKQLGFTTQNTDEADAIGILDFVLDFHEHFTPPWRKDEVLRPVLGGV